MNRVALVLAVWLAGLGAAAQFGKISLGYAALEAAYPAHAGVGIALMVSVVGMVGLVFGTTAGLMVARIGARRVMLSALVTGAAISGIEALLPPWPVMMLVRVLEGASHLAIVVVGPMAIAGAASLRWQPLAMTLWSTFFGLTYAILALIAPPVLAAGGLPLLFLGHGAWMAASALLLAGLMPRDAAPAPRAEGPGHGLIAGHVAIYASPVIAAPATGFVFYALIYVAVLTLLPQAFGPDLRAGVAAGMPLVSIAVSLTFGVWGLRHFGAVRMVGFGFATGALAMAGLALVWSLPLAAVGCAMLMAAAMGVVQGASFASIPALIDRPEDRARASGALAQLGNLGTTLGTPVLAGMVGVFGPAGFPAFALPLCLVGGAVVALQAARRSRARNRLPDPGSARN